MKTYGLVFMRNYYCCSYFKVVVILKVEALLSVSERRAASFVSSYNPSP